ncbi:MAG TPA: substrate-binding domain-containing protein [Candidatus Bathyarchaeia archaeon]|nr:substrate-binding domain-containing protein [Candidatus Bathyarchaeia archaeon]
MTGVFALALVLTLAPSPFSAFGDTNKEFMSPFPLTPFPTIGDTNKEFMSPFAERTLMLATTTSVDATGLLNVLADAFQADTGLTLKWIAVGTGAALKQARDGNADVVIVHARKLEEEFLRDGSGVNRRVIARNYFMIVGPPDDPAGVSRAASAGEAFGRIRANGAAFASRGDKSGTHTRELELWAAAGGKPDTSYLETGQGMAETLRVAAERRAYTLTDTATFAALRGLAGLVPLFESAPDLENIYAVIAVNPFRVPTARYAEAMAFIAFLASPRGQKIIGEFKGQTDRPLFEPMAAVPGVDLLK